jgi:hypothetical protein
MKYSKSHLVKTLLALVVSHLAVASHAQVLSLRFAPHASCPDGLSGCWGGIHDTLERVDSLKVNLVPDFSCWMVAGFTKNGGLPDLEALTKMISQAGPFYSLRGIEVKAKGQLLHKQDGLYMSLPDGATVRLVQARVSHEVIPATRKERELTEEEKAAFTQLKQVKDSDYVVTGWMAPKKPGEVRQIEVVKWEIPQA